MNTGETRLVKILRWIARILCLVITLFIGVMLAGAVVGDMLDDGFTAVSAEGLWLLLIGIIALAGCILSWWQDLSASILLLVTAAGLGIHIGISAEQNHFLAWSMLGAPYLVAGLLLFWAWRLTPKS